MTGPGGETSRGWWQVTSVAPPGELEFTDGWADQDGKPKTDLPTTAVQVRLTEQDGRTRMELRFTVRLRRVHGAARALGCVQA